VPSPPIEAPDRRGRAIPWARVLGAAVLFGGSAAVVLWQNTRVAALHDLSYILNTAYRIWAGDVPYRDFSQPHAPLTFLIQAAILGIFDSSYVHHVWYAALLSGAATLLGFETLHLLLRPHFARARTYAFVACLLLIPLGLHSLFPIPWYDADASFIALLAVYALLRAHQPQALARWAAIAGALVVLAVFAKQNMGLALLAASQSLALPWLLDRARRRRYVVFVASTGVSLALALALIEASCGLDNYVRWTFSFAAERRLVLKLPFAPYRRAELWAWLAAPALGLLLLGARQRSREASAPQRWNVADLLGTALLLAPLLAPLVVGPGHRAALFARLWPLTMPLAAALAVLTWLRDRSRFEPFLVATLLGFCYGTFLSQGVAASSFAVWPVFCLLLGGILIGLRSLAPGLAPRLCEAYLAAAVTAAVVTGVPQLVSNRRLDYARHEGRVYASRHPRLAGLHAGGDYLPRLDELLAFFERRVPADEGFTAIPGEDPLYFALRRRPRLPLVQFDRTVNTLGPEQFVERAEASGIEWIVAKRKRQLRRQSQTRFAATVRLALRDYEPVFENDTYLVMRRRR
jgi:hypothetical protein